ncbi:MAG: hypothetical protein MUF00_19445 [Gemmatimonadaceae bacterium]|nr:hypothetical protein [Gemmatimonadaceae bacterium]
MVSRDAARPMMKMNGRLSDSTRARLGLGAVQVVAPEIDSPNEVLKFTSVDLTSASSSAVGWGRADSTSHVWIDSIPPGRYVHRTRRLGLRTQIRSIDVPPGCVVTVQAYLVSFDGELKVTTGWPIPSRSQRLWQTIQSRVAPPPVEAERPEPEYDGRVVIRSCERT